MYEPYIQILEINNSSTFIANKAKTFDEEKIVADKAPVEDIEVKSINGNVDKVKNKNKLKRKFSYIIKIADFYYLDSAKLLEKRLFDELNVKDAKILKLSKTKFRLFMGPYSNIDELKISFNKIVKLEFENVEIIKKWKNYYYSQS